jgi:trk system potassium uptake protein TrkH
MKKWINAGFVLNVISRNLIILSAALGLCIIIALAYSEPVRPFLTSFMLALVLGTALLYSTRKELHNVVIQRREAYLTVTLSWIMLGLLGALPYWLSGAIPSPVNAIFESVSGFTTTGSSILIDIEGLPKSILFWRSLTHWIGGIGIIVLVIVVMPSLQMGGYHLFSMESSLQDKIQARIKGVGKRLLLIYILLTAAETGLLLIGNMNLYESVCHAFGTVATGGFSPRNTSIADYSPYIQYVIMLFMFLAGTNFAVHYYLFKRDFKRIKANEEVRFFLLMTIIIGGIITTTLFVKTDRSFEQSFRDGFFQVISIITCTGFATSDYMEWPRYAWLVIFFAMFLGGSTGSTAGGIKMVRHLLLLKNIRHTFRKMLQPNAIFPIKINKNTLNTDSNNAILSFILAYFLIFVAASLTLIFIGVGTSESASAVATCMAGIGPGLGKIGPAGNFAYLPDAAKWLLSFIMLIGRLEIYTVLVLFTPGFWRV